MSLLISDKDIEKAAEAVARRVGEQVQKLLRAQQVRGRATVEVVIEADEKGQDQ